MIFLSGGFHPPIWENPRPDLGLMVTPVKYGHPWRGRVPVAYDNGCFTEGHRFDAAKWLHWLAGVPPERALFAVAPDVVGDAVATLERSRPHLAAVRRLGFPVAFVSQDGADAHPPPWDDFDCLFVGGSTAWKLCESSYVLCAEAKRRGKWVHMGRVNTLRRLRACRVSMVDSADGTHVAFKPDARLPQLLRWLDGLAAQSVLEVPS